MYDTPHPNTARRFAPGRSTGPLERFGADAVSVVVVVVMAAVMAACGSSGGAAAPTRAYVLRLHIDDSSDEYAYVAADPVDLRIGDAVTFRVTNTGTLIHDMQIIDPAGTEVGAMAPIPAGGTADVTVLFDEAGYYRLDCLIDDHLTRHHMQSIVEVVDAGDVDATDTITSST
ncbi:MAG: hypothetical protein ABIO83_07025 [Ilumatobacteraceae bacterium]